METARIEKRIGVRASSDQVWSVIADLPSWGGWNPVESRIEGTIAFGGQLAFNESLPGAGDREATARVVEWQPYAQLVWAEKRGLWFRSLRYFEIQSLESPDSCILANGFIFEGLKGEMFFDKHRGTLRRAVDAVAEAWKTAGESAAV
jgi:hypothetical protein